MSESGRILVVDDDSDVRFMLHRYLERHGFAIEAVEDGERMRAALEENHFDLVVLDLTLPGEDGLSLARYLRSHSDVGIIMLTAAAEVVDRVVGLEMGADDYVTKPFEPRELLARIKSVLRRLEARTAEPATGSAGQAARSAVRPVRARPRSASTLRRKRRGDRDNEHGVRPAQGIRRAPG